jgi:hypothetical protein
MKTVAPCMSLNLSLFSLMIRILMAIISCNDLYSTDLLLVGLVGDIVPVIFIGYTGPKGWF